MFILAIVNKMQCLPKENKNSKLEDNAELKLNDWQIEFRLFPLNHIWICLLVYLKLKSESKGIIE